MRNGQTLMIAQVQPQETQSPILVTRGASAWHTIQTHREGWFVIVRMVVSNICYSGASNACVGVFLTLKEKYGVACHLKLECNTKR